MPIGKRFLPLRVTAASMAKLHTAVVTEDDGAVDNTNAKINLNVRVCGFGNGGRLGLGGGSGVGAQHTQYALTPVKDPLASALALSVGSTPAQAQGSLDSHIIAVALGQDHTLALTAAGNVLSWGLNRFSQLGYATEGPSHLQLSPRRVVGVLKREEIMGVAACRTASACWSWTGELWTWGTSNGQLGWEEKGGVAGSPRRVTSVPGKVIDAKLGENAMVVLLESRDVVCFWNGRSFKVNFPTHTFPSEIQPYRHPMAQNKVSIAKVVHCLGEETFATLSTNGEVFTFVLGPPVPSGEHSQTPFGNPGRPQRVWALRKQFSAVKVCFFSVSLAFIY